MNENEKKILLSLMEDARLPTIEIGKRAGVSRQTAAKKIEELKKTLVKRFSVEIDPRQLGLNLRAYILLNESPNAALRKRNEEVITRIPQVKNFHRVFGRFSAILEIWAKDEGELGEIVKKIHKLKGIKETETFITHTSIKADSNEPLIHAIKHQS
ncbi:MAG: Lrp/AsnC family transcriptional regulator [Candidatus Hadarchaeales archaeon]